MLDLRVDITVIVYLQDAVSPVGAPGIEHKYPVLGLKMRDMRMSEYADIRADVPRLASQVIQRGFDPVFMAVSQKYLLAAERKEPLKRNVGYPPVVVAEHVFAFDIGKGE